MPIREEYRVIITAAYDTAKAGRHIQKMLSRVNAQLGEGDEPVFDLRLWSTEMLGAAEHFESALSDAVLSDVLVLAFAGHERRWNGLENLVAEWAAQRRGQVSALWVLLAERDADDPLVPVLRTMARRHNLDFICSRDAFTWGYGAGDRAIPNAQDATAGEDCLDAGCACPLSP